MSFKTWRRRGKKGIPKIKLSYKTKFVLLEIVYGAILGSMSFVTAFLIAEFSVWVFLQWMFAVERILMLYYLFFALINGLFFFIPIYNRRPIQLIAAAVLVVAVYVLLIKRFSFDPIITVFGPPNY
ncbi:MAG: hypothetical protein DRO00_05225 [Thermoproteota archaeon]|nr:MAG: hypothetical protein DRN92_06055 [Candidatus Korarchaeota archaeon]RLG49697.1 MAG: hypothetical protein DRN90_01070 [Candidatus Korarchaeota archaeon]RLG52719.1 MAG: hypothetical protein DRO00_05225 [Candidatus Korarchaeota archaeon]